MKHNRHKKQSNNRRKMELSLIKDLSPLSNQGSFLNFCMNEDAKSKKYKNAKKRYLALLDHAEKRIKDIKEMIEIMEKESIKEQKHSKLAELDKERNEKLQS